MTNLTGAIGIDLGTTYSGVTEFYNGAYINVRMDDGNEVIPSVVAFTDQAEPCFGAQAEEIMKTDPQNTLFDIKRLIGRDWQDPTIDPKTNNWPFKLLNVEGSIKLEVKHQGEVRQYSPEHISGMFLKYLKTRAIEKLGKEISLIVVTIPAYFTYNQEEATRKACEYAGFSEFELLSEPTAAALSAPSTMLVEGQILMVYDFGGGTLDVSIQKFECAAFTVLGTYGDTHLGGRDVDNCLVAYFREKFEKENNVELKNDWKAITKLRQECEKVKISLSRNTNAEIHIQRFYQNKNLNMRISRAEFNRINDHLFKRAIGVAQEALHRTNLLAEQVHTILMVGGSSGIPRVRQLLEETFGKEKVQTTSHTEFAVMYGAAKYAAILSGYTQSLFDKFRLLQEKPYAIGVLNDAGQFVQLIKANTSLPARGVRYVTTSRNNQSRVTINVYESNPDSKEHHQCIGQLVIQGIPAETAGKPRILVRLILDEKGMLQAEAFIDGRGDTKKRLTCSTTRAQPGCKFDES